MIIIRKGNTEIQGWLSASPISNAVSLVHEWVKRTSPMLWLEFHDWTFENNRNTTPIYKYLGEKLSTAKVQEKPDPGNPTISASQSCLNTDILGHRGIDHQSIFLHSPLQNHTKVRGLMRILLVFTANMTHNRIQLQEVAQSSFPYFAHPFVWYCHTSVGTLHLAFFLWGKIKHLWVCTACFLQRGSRGCFKLQWIKWI